MKKQKPVDAKIVLHLDSSHMSIDPLTLNWGDLSSSQTCLVFFSESEEILKQYSESSSLDGGKKVHDTLVQMIDKNNPSLFGLQIFYSNPMILASEFEEAMNRPMYFSPYVLHIVLTNEPIQSFLDIHDLCFWKKRFFSEVKKLLTSTTGQMHGLFPSTENTVSSVYTLKADTAFLCFIALHQYLQKSASEEHQDINFLNLLLQLSNEKNPDQFCTQEYSEVCIHYAHHLNRMAKDLEDCYKLSYIKASNRLLDIIINRFKNLGKIELNSSCIDLALANKAILSETIPPHELLQRLITDTELLLGSFHDTTEVDFKKSGELLNKSQKVLESSADKIPTHLIKKLEDAYQLARFKFYFKKSIDFKKNNFHLDAWVTLRSALSFLLASSESQNDRYLAIIHHHLGILKNLIEDETCNEHLIEAMIHYELAEMLDSAQKIKTTLLRIELNKSIKENPDEEKECCFLFWKTAIEKGDMAKFSFIHSYLKKNAHRIEIDSLKKLMK